MHTRLRLISKRPQAPPPRALPALRPLPPEVLAALQYVTAAVHASPVVSVDGLGTCVAQLAEEEARFRSRIEAVAERLVACGQKGV